MNSTFWIAPQEGLYFLCGFGWTTLEWLLHKSSGFYRWSNTQFIILYTQKLFRNVLRGWTIPYWHPEALSLRHQHFLQFLWPEREDVSQVNMLKQTHQCFIGFSCDQIRKRSKSRTQKEINKWSKRWRPVVHSLLQCLQECSFEVVQHADFHLTVPQ